MGEGEVAEGRIGGIGWERVRGREGLLIMAVDDILVVVVMVVVVVVVVVMISRQCSCPNCCHAYRWRRSSTFLPIPGSGLTGL
jgi:hypothetical protein